MRSSGDANCDGFNGAWEAVNIFSDLVTTINTYSDILTFNIGLHTDLTWFYMYEKKLLVLIIAIIHTFHVWL